MTDIFDYKIKQDNPANYIALIKDTKQLIMFEALKFDNNYTLISVCP